MVVQRGSLSLARLRIVFSHLPGGEYNRNPITVESKDGRIDVGHVLGANILGAVPDARAHLGLRESGGHG